MADRRTLAQLDHLLRPLRNRVANALARAVVKLVDDGKALQSLQAGVLSEEDVDDCERFQEFGFSGVPLEGAEAVVLFPNGDRGRPLVVAVDDRRYRPRGKSAGTVTVYNHTGAKVIIEPDGDIEVQPAVGRQVFVRSTGGSAERLVKKGEFDAHVHTCAGSGSPSTPPTVAAVGTQKLQAE